jgi:hypothetical protein
VCVWGVGRHANAWLVINKYHTLFLYNRRKRTNDTKEKQMPKTKQEKLNQNIKKAKRNKNTREREKCGVKN